MTNKRSNIRLIAMHSAIAALTLTVVITGVAAADQPVSVTLDRDFRPNARQIRGQSRVRSQSLRRAFGTASDCTGWVAAQPDAVIVLPKGLGRTHLIFSGGGEGYGNVYLQLPNRKYYCGKRKLTLDSLPAGRLEVYFRRMTMWRNKIGPFTITIEDLSRPLTSPWKSNIKTLSLPKQLAKPMIFVGKTGSDLRLSDGHNDMACRKLALATNPFAMLKIDRPRDDLSYSLASAGSVALQIIGPLTKSGRHIKTRCLGGRRGKLGRFEPGTYALKVGQHSRARRAAPTQYTMLLRTANTHMEPFAVADVPAGLPLRAREVGRHYPQIDEDFWRSPETLQRLFASAPKGLFVFPTFDFDKASAKSIHAFNKHPSYPRKNEPMLLYASRWIVGADGATFEVKKYSYLQTEPTGAIALPKAPRNIHVDDSEALQQLGPEDRASHKTYLRHVAAEKRCVDRVWRPTNRKIDALRQRAWSRWRVKRIASLKDKAGSRAFKSCGTAKLRREWANLQKKWQRTRRTRRTRRLAAVRARLQRMFR